MTAASRPHLHIICGYFNAPSLRKSLGTQRTWWFYQNIITSIERVFGSLTRCNILAEHSPINKPRKGASWTAKNANAFPYVDGRAVEQDERISSGPGANRYSGCFRSIKGFKGSSLALVRLNASPLSIKASSEAQRSVRRWNLTTNLLSSKFDHQCFQSKAT